MKNNLFVTLFTFIVFIYASQAQSISSEVIANSGDNFINQAASLTWTLGESATDVLINQPFIHTQGFHQTYLNTKTNSPDLLNSAISVYPNPAREFVNVSFKNINQEVTLELVDVSGKKHFSKNINTHETYRLNLKNLADGKYLLQINSSENQVFGIIKSSK